MYRDQIFEPAQITMHNNIAYSTRANADGLQYTSEHAKADDRKRDTLTLTMDIQVPPNATETAPQPVVIFVHGGGFVGGSKEPKTKEMQAWALAGYVAVTIDYRLTAQNSASEDRRIFAVRSALEDTQNAIRFLKAHAGDYHIDTTRMALMGGSAGGALALLNAVERDAAGTVNDFPGVSSETAVSVSTGATLINDDLANQPGLVRFDAGDTPALMFHAKPADPATEATWDDNAVPTQRAFQAVGVTCELVAQPSSEHTVNLVPTGNYRDELLEFFTRELKLPA